MRWTSNSTPVATLSLAINHRYRQGDDWVEDVCYIDCSVFGRQAEAATDYLSKGSPVLIEGRLRFRTWETQEGQKRSKHDVLARRKTGVCDVGEMGVCYEVYTLGNRLGYSFIFERGRYDGFSPEEVTMFLIVTDEVCPPIANYQFRNVIRLCRDFQQGRFDEAFLTRQRHP